MIVNGKHVSNESETYLIAEIGINHNGSLTTAFKLIDEAVNAGFDAVKFQKRTIDVVYNTSDLQMPRDSVFGSTNGDLKRGLEFSWSDYLKISEYCKFKKIDWFASAWDIESVNFLESLGVVAHKVASACNTDKNLLVHLSKTQKPIFLSTGMSSLGTIKRAVNLLDPQKLVLMHTISTYPALDENLNLNWINILKKEFPEIPIGYSGHEAGVIPSVIAVAKYGACVVERHITLDRSMWGSDQAASLEPTGMKKLVSYVKLIPLLHGSNEKILLDIEEPVSRKLRRINDI